MPISGLVISDFQFTQVLENNIPYEVTGYAVGTCSGTTAYVAPYGWNVVSCLPMPTGSYGAPPNANVALIFCEPDESIVAINTTPTTGSTLFEQMGGTTGVLLMGLAAVGLLVGWGYLANKSTKK
jgi:hypothetical protein